MYRGRYALGQEIPLGVWCFSSAGTPTLPDSPPLMRVYDNTPTLRLSKLIPIRDSNNEVGFFSSNIFLNAAFAVGLYTVSYNYAIGGIAFGDSDTFEIIAGGSPDGAIESMWFWRQPAGNFIVYQLSSGQIGKGRNPIVL